MRLENLHFERTDDSVSFLDGETVSVLLRIGDIRLHLILEKRIDVA